MPSYSNLLTRTMWKIHNLVWRISQESRASRKVWHSLRNFWRSNQTFFNRLWISWLKILFPKDQCKISISTFALSDWWVDAGKRPSPTHHLQHPTWLWSLILSFRLTLRSTIRSTKREPINSTSREDCQSLDSVVSLYTIKIMSTAKYGSRWPE